MILKLRKKMVRDESGFTLVELLVVMLILGLWPRSRSRRSSTRGTRPRTRRQGGRPTAETAMETFATDNNGTYAAAPAAELQPSSRP